MFKLAIEAIFCYNLGIMPKSNIQTLTQLIQRSKLLSEDRKQTLLDVLLTLTDEQIAHLESLLTYEGVMIKENAISAIQNAVTEEDNESLEQLSEFLHKAERTLRKEDEKAERTQEKQDTQSFFSDAA